MPSTQRLSGPATQHAQRFVVPPASSGLLQQYSHLYTQRLGLMRARLLALAAERWPSVRAVGRIIDCEYAEEGEAAAGGEGEDCVVVGTAYKEMRMRPSVLDEFRDSQGTGVGGPVAPLAKYASEDDTLLLEDESGRIELAGPLLPELRASLVTGVVPALRGRVTSSGCFAVTEVLYSWSGFTREPVAPPASEAYVLLVSGLALGSAADSHALHMLADFVCGRLGADSSLAGKVVRVIVAGNSLAQAHIAKRKFGSDAKNADKPVAATNLAQLDALLADMLTACCVDLMPGASDPATLALPQQPLHPCLLPAASRFSTFCAVTNPYELETCGRVLLGTSGQNVADTAMQQLGLGEPLEALKCTLRWGHLCPTAPDTLACVPLCGDDPFVLDPTRPPAVYFAGNQVRPLASLFLYPTSLPLTPPCHVQPRFASELVASPRGVQTLVVCVPAFSAAQEAVLVNLASLEARVVSFKVRTQG